MFNVISSDLYSNTIYTPIYNYDRENQNTIKFTISYCYNIKKKTVCVILKSSLSFFIIIYIL